MKETKKKRYTLEQIHKMNEVKYTKNSLWGVFLRKNFSVHITKFLVNNTDISPNQITLLTFVIGIISAYLFSTGDIIKMAIAGILIQIYWIFDAVDGEIARIKNMCSKKGAFIDGVLDRLKDCMIFFGISYGLFRQTNNSLMFAYGFIALSSVLMTQITISYASGIFDSGKLKSSQSNIFLVRWLNKLGIKSRHIALQQEIYLLIITIGAVLNKLVFSLWFFMIIVNLYWIVMVIMIWFSKDGNNIQEKGKKPK